MLLIMTVNPGYGGQSFISNSLRRIKDAVELREKLKANFLIEVDGGINTETIVQAKEAGAQVFVTGSSVFRSDNISASVTELKNLIR